MKNTKSLTHTINLWRGAGIHFDFILILNLEAYLRRQSLFMSSTTFKLVCFNQVVT